ncbi:MAG: 50S ribosomal protein L32 [Chloroflexi bacterium]|nr:50S ribosomal protein L32 [Chloroflexota bacterium]MDA1297390.1 50S ribosomal protein L32 [Chloroflexota bacterium]
MTPLPKKKRTRRQRGHNRSHHAISLPAISVCPCPRKITIRPHRACPMCGNYKGLTIPGSFALDNLIQPRQAVAAATATEDSGS